MAKPNKKGVYIDPDLAWEYIEMGRDTDGLYPAKWKTKSKFPIELLLEGEQHQFLNAPLDDYVLTSLGRVFSVAQNKPKQLSPNIYQYSIAMSIRDIRVNILNRMDALGWHKTFNEIKDIYISNKWSHYRYYFEDGATAYELITYESK